MMKKYLLVLFVLVTMGINTAFSAVQKSSIQPVNLHCEYLVNPVGLDELVPRFSWTYAATNLKAYGQKQTAYRIIVASDGQILRQNKVMSGIQAGLKLIKCSMLNIKGSH